LDSVLKRLQDLRGNDAGAAVSIPMPAAPPASGQKPFRAEESSIQPLPSPSSPNTVATVRETPPATMPPPGDVATLWNSLVEAVGRVSLFTRTYLLEAHPVSFKNNVLVIGFPPDSEDHLGLVDNARNHELLQTKLAELGHSQAQVKFIKS